MSAQSPRPAYETRIDGPVAPRVRWAAWLGGAGALHAAERAAVARTHGRLARDLVAGIAAARLQAVHGAGVPAVLAGRVRALAALRARALAADGRGRGSTRTHPTGRALRPVHGGGALPKGKSAC
jgi:hypothetical protein